MCSLNWAHFLRFSFILYCNHSHSTEPPCLHLHFFMTTGTFVMKYPQGWWFLCLASSTSFLPLTSHSHLSSSSSSFMYISKGMGCSLNVSGNLDIFVTSMSSSFVKEAFAGLWFHCLAWLLLCAKKNAHLLRTWCAYVQRVLMCGLDRGTIVFANWTPYLNSHTSTLPYCSSVPGTQSEKNGLAKGSQGWYYFVY